MKDLNDEGEKMGEGNWNESDLWQREAEENGLQTEPELQNAVQNPKQIRKTCLREVRRLQCPRLGDGIFQRDDGACQHTSGSSWQRMGGRRRDQYVFEPDGKCSVV